MEPIKQRALELAAQYSDSNHPQFSDKVIILAKKFEAYLKGKDDEIKGTNEPPKKVFMVGSVPRRAILSHYTKPEGLIHEIVKYIEKMPADPLLTDAVCLLNQAQEKVADFVESEKGMEWCAGK